MMTKRDRVRGRMALATMQPAIRRLIQVTIDGVADLETNISGNRSIAGAACVIAACCGMPPDKLRPAVVLAWEAAHGDLIQAADNICGSGGLTRVLRYAAFPAINMPPTVRVWRGTMGLTLNQARRGISWTCHYDVACWYALSFWCSRGAAGNPFVLRRDVPRKSVIPFAPNNVGEILLDAPPGGTIDINPNQWAEAAKRVASRLGIFAQGVDHFAAMREALHGATAASAPISRSSDQGRHALADGQTAGCLVPMVAKESLTGWGG